MQYPLLPKKQFPREILIGFTTRGSEDNIFINLGEKDTTIEYSFVQEVGLYLHKKSSTHYQDELILFSEF